MNLHPRSLLAAALMASIGLTSARADYATTFATPPYLLDQTVIGIDGWDYRLPPASDRSEASRVVAVRWDGYKPAMMLKYANLKHAAPPTTGAKAKVTFDLAVNFPDAGPTGKQFRLGFTNAPFGEIFMDLSPDGGLGYQADGSGRGGIVVFKKKEIRINSYYTFAVTVDYQKSTYDITITGLKKDGSPAHYQAEGVAFESKTKTVSSLIILSGSSLTAYLRSMAVKSE